MRKPTARLRAALGLLLLDACVCLSSVPAMAQVTQPETTPASHLDVTRPQSLADEVRARRQVYLWVVVKGSVRDAQGRPIPGAEVILLRPKVDDMGRNRTHLTNRKSKFAFRTWSRAGYYLTTDTDGSEKSLGSDDWMAHGRRFPGLVITRYFRM